MHFTFSHTSPLCLQLLLRAHWFFITVWTGFNGEFSVLVTAKCWKCPHRFVRVNNEFCSDTPESLGNWIRIGAGVLCDSKMDGCLPAVQFKTDLLSRWPVLPRLKIEFPFSRRKISAHFTGPNTHFFIRN